MAYGGNPQLGVITGWTPFGCWHASRESEIHRQRAGRADAKAGDYTVRGGWCAPLCLWSRSCGRGPFNCLHGPCQHPLLTPSSLSSPFLSLLSSLSANPLRGLLRVLSWVLYVSSQAGSVLLMVYLLIQLPWISQRLLTDTFPPEPFFMLQSQESIAHTSKESHWAPCFPPSPWNEWLWDESLPLSTPCCAAFSLQHIPIAECLQSSFLQ